MSPPVKPAVTLPAAAKHIRRLSSASRNDWAPFRTQEEFTLDAIMLLVFIICFILSAFFLNYIINRFINNSSTYEDRRRKQISQEFVKSAGPTVEFSSNIKMAGTDTCCPICLSEFVDGERIRVLPKCSHGFHVDCIEKWLLLYRNTCPTCRTLCMNIPAQELDTMPTTSHGGRAVGESVDFDVLDDDDIEVETGAAADIPILTVRQQHENSTTTTGSSSSSSGTAAATAGAAN